MKFKAKTYSQFINEAYIDSSGELRDLDFTPQEELDLALMEELNVISDFLEDSGAKNVKLNYDVDANIAEFRFHFMGRYFLFEFNITTEEVMISESVGRVHTWVEVYQDSAQNAFDLLSNTGLDFLLY
jgi:hypothetical protein